MGLFSLLLLEDSLLVGPLDNDKVLMVVEAVEVSIEVVIGTSTKGSFLTSMSDVLGCRRT